MEDIEDLSEEDEGKALTWPVTKPSGKKRRRGKASCSRFFTFVTTFVRNLTCCKSKKRKRRQEFEVVEEDGTPRNGITFRMLGGSKRSLSEVVVIPSEDAPPFPPAPSAHTLEVALEPLNESRRPSRETYTDRDGQLVFLPRTSSFSGGQEAEERLLSRAVGRLTASVTSRPRFLTLHKRRRKRPPTRGLVREGAILDDLYHGPTQCVLQGSSLWDFNAFVLDSVCGGRPVALLCVFLLHEHGLLRHFALDPVTVWKCFNLIEEGYHSSNPYHNAIHAADVTQAMHCYLQEEVIGKYLTPFEKLAAILASVCHDLDHPGVNQPFLIATDNHLAALYNNASVLENHHWRCAMGCLWESGLLDDWSTSQVEDFQEMIRSLILATDITRQNEFLTRFKVYQDTNTLDMTSAECRHFSLQIALKCADICNPCRPWETSRQWSQKICDEFYRQGDYERQLRLPVTSMCDRYSNSVANIQTGFIKFVVQPLFESWDRWLRTPLSGAMLENLRNNLHRWHEVLMDEVGGAVIPAAGVSSKRSSVESVSGVVVSELSRGSRVHSVSSTASSDVASDRSVVEGTRPLVGRRRHSLPVTFPSVLPRTIMRRESLTRGEAGASPLVLETLKVGEKVVDSVVTVGVGGEEEPMFSRPSVVTMGDIGKPRRLFAHARAQRRQSLPPLWDSSSLPPRAPLQPLPPTPLQEELPPFVPDQQKEEEKLPQAKSGVGCALATSTGERDQGGNGGSQYRSTERRCSVGRRAPSDNLGGKVDKENVAPCGTADRLPSNNILKTRLWRSLNHEEDAEVLTGIGTKSLFKHFTSQNLAMRRRGSAPLLKPEELRGGLRGGSDRINQELHPRRGSAPSHQLTVQLGSDALRLLSEEKSHQWVTPLFPKDKSFKGAERSPLNALILAGTGRLAQRRGSVPWDGLKADHQLLLSCPGMRVNEVSAGERLEGCGSIAQGYPDVSHRGGGGGLTPLSGEDRRGSAGFELLSGLWR